MKRLTRFILADIKNIVRDPMQTLTAIAPLIIIVVLRIALPIAREKILEFFHYDILRDYAMIVIFFSMLIPMMVGLVIGFVILDERDESMITYFAVTPLSKSGYLFFRVIIPAIFSFVFSVVFFLSFYDICPLDFSVILMAAMLLSIQAPVFPLLMASIAANKVEGLAVGKLLGMVIMPPIVYYIISSKWALLLLVIPQTWLVEIAIGKHLNWFIGFIFFLAAVIHVFVLFVSVRIFKNRID